MENDGEPREFLLDLLEDVETQRGWDEDALGIAGALLRFEFIRSMAGADRDSQGVNAGLGDKIDDFGRLGVGGVLEETSSSIPASTPSSPSTVTSCLWAYSTTRFVRATFSS